MLWKNNLSVLQNNLLYRRKVDNDCYEHKITLCPICFYSQVKIDPTGLTVRLSNFFRQEFRYKRDQKIIPEAHYDDWNVFYGHTGNTT